MPRENSFSDYDGRSLTPDLEEATEAANGEAARTLVRQSPRSNVSHHMTSRSPPAIPPLVRFRAIVRKVIHLHRSAKILSSRGVGAEPGVDPRRHSAKLAYGHIQEDCIIEVMDYSSLRCSEGRMGNREFVQLLEDTEAERREPWVKVRWINIVGVSWDVVSALTLKYQLHPLAIEDVLHTRDQNRSKSDYFTRHLFLRVLIHSLAGPDEFTPQFAPTSLLAHPTSLTDLPRVQSPTTFSEVYKNLGGDEEEEYLDSKRSMTGQTKRRAMGYLRRRPTPMKDLEYSPSTLSKGFSSAFNTLGASRSQAQTSQMKEEMTIEALKKGSRVHVKVSPMYIFLLRDGTLISISRSKNGLEMTDPIRARLRQRDTMLRTSADAPLLLQSLLDLIVDEAMEVIDEYQGKILKLEHEVLLKPKMKTVRQLHILSGDLILHKRTLEPIRTLVYGLRRYDTDRCAALIEGPVDAAKVQGFMSHKSKIYLADVHDHMEYILTSLDMFSGIAENLINYTFNMASYQMNEVMRRLTLATIIFLPLTLLTGYFGMNFENMWSIHHGHSDVVFWIIAIPVMVIVIPLFLYNDLERMVHFVMKKWSVKKAVKEKVA